MRLTSKPLAALILFIMFGGIFFTSAMNWWQTETSKVPVKFTSGETAGEYNPADIRGSYTFGDVSGLFEIPIEDLASAFDLPAAGDPAAVSLKDLETIYAASAEAGMEIGTGSVRLFTAFYTGLPYDLSAEDSYLPQSAADILLAKVSLTNEQLAYLDSHVVGGSEIPVTETAPVSEVAPEVETPQPAETSPEEHVEDTTIIKGKTTFQEVIDLGVSREQIETILGGSIPATGMLVKDYCTQQGIEFASIRDSLQAAVDAVQTPLP